MTAPPDASHTPPVDSAEPRFELPRWITRFMPVIESLADPEAGRLLVSGVVVGALGGIAAGIFDKAMVLVGLIVLGQAEPAAHAPVWWRSLFGPAIVGAVAGLILRYGTKRHRAQGVADVMGRTQLYADTLSLREGLPSAIAAALIVGGGQSGGREGPIVQVASALASAACRLLRVPHRHFRALVAAGAAAGVAASFNTPLGGAFFALEIILGDFAVESFAPVVAATVTGTVVGQILLGDRVALHLPPLRLGSPLELPLYLGLGLVAGLVAVVFKRLLIWAPHRADAFGLPLPVRATAAGLIVGAAAALGAHPIMGNGYAWMEETISHPERVELGLLALLFLSKPLATAVTAAGRGGSGLFAPSLYVGAVTGLTFGSIARLAFPSLDVVPGAFGMVGMGAVCAAVLHAPITMTLMLFEMTGNYQIILPLLLALATSGFVSSMLGSESIYELELKRSGLPQVRRRSSQILFGVRVADLMRASEYEVARNDAPLQELLPRFFQRRVDELWVVDADGRLHGLVDLQDVKDLLLHPKEGVVAADVVVADVPRLQPQDPLADTVPLFFRSAREELPVVDGNGRLVGVLSERDVVAAYHREVARKDALLARVDSRRGGVHQTDFVELPEGEALEVVDVDERLADRTLKELRLPDTLGITVVAISRWNARTARWDRRTVASGERLQEGDRLVVVGATEKVAALAVRS